MQINKNNLDWIQIDITARCQAMCLECSRNINGKDLNPKIESADSWDMPLNIFQKAVTPEMLSTNLQRVVLNGNFGDPCIHPKFIDISKYIVDHAHKDLSLNISTNGAMFDNEYWKQVAQTLSGLKNHKIIFAIDGLEDTHHIYRRNTSYQDVIDHARTFIHHGGKADWQFIIFDHNKHQVDEAKRRAKEIGFDNIFFKGGFSDDDKGSARNYYKAAEGRIDAGKGAKTKKDPQVKLSIKDREGFQKAFQEAQRKIYQKTNYLDTSTISCQWYDTKGMYVEYDGTVWMCCWTGDMHRTHNQSITTEWKNIENKFGKHFNNLNYHSFNDILNHEFFVSYLDKTFNSTRSDADTPRLNTCAKTCIWNKTFV